jgi:predicted dehydrogenase
MLHDVTPAPSSPPLRAGLAGCGGIAGLTLAASERSPDFRVVALMDPDPKALARTGDGSGIACRHVRFEDLLAEDLDFLILAGPNHVHATQVIQAADAGLDCLVQKPMARTAADARAMVVAVRRLGIRLGVVMVELGNPLHHQVRRMVEDSWFGEPVIVSGVAAHDIYLRNPPPEGDWRRDPARVGGAAFIQLAIHQVNLASWILGRRITSVSAAGSRGQTVFEDETTVALARFSGGLLATFAASYATAQTSFAILGTRGRILLHAGRVLIRGDRPYEGSVFDYVDPGRELAFAAAELEPTISRQRDALEVHGAFARWLRGRGTCPATGEDGLRDMEVAEAIQRSREEGRWIDVG